MGRKGKVAYLYDGLFMLIYIYKVAGAPPHVLPESLYTSVKLWLTCRRGRWSILWYQTPHEATSYEDD